MHTAVRCGEPDGTYPVGSDTEQLRWIEGSLRGSSLGLTTEASLHTPSGWSLLRVSHGISSPRPSSTLCLQCFISSWSIGMEGA